MQRIARVLPLLSALATTAALGGCSLHRPSGELASPAGDDPYPSAALPPTTASLQEALAWLAEQAPTMSPGTVFAVSVASLPAGERASVAGSASFVSASVAKPLWVAAALAHARVSDVAALAPPIFEQSDNAAAGGAIDLLGPSPEGPNRVNAFLWDEVGLVNTALIDWSDEHRVRLSTNAPATFGDENYTTTDDLVAFLEAIDRGDVLGPDRSPLLERWMTTSPRRGFGGWLGTQLPEAARASMMQKAGWLEPGCCLEVEEADSVLNEMGIVTVPGGHRYAIAMLARQGRDYRTRQAGFIELASCVVYRAVSRTPIACEPPDSGVSADGSDCGDVTAQGYCEGSVLTRCESGELSRIDCAPAGFSCRWDDRAIGYGCVTRP